MNVYLKRLLEAQHDVVAAWQLVQRGWTRHAIEHRIDEGDWLPLHDGVYTRVKGPLTRFQRWMAAALTAPRTFLAHASAGACWGFRPFEGDYETVVRPGSGGPKRLSAVLVCRSSRLEGETTRIDALPITGAARTVVDLAPGLRKHEVGRMYREAIRLKTVTARELAAALHRHQGRRGTRLLRELTDRYSGLPYSRTRSNAEARALELLQDAGVTLPAVNVRVAGEEADLVWRAERRIIEIDGPQYHQFEEEDQRKQALWERAGYTVNRVPSGAIYTDPDALIALTPGRTFRLSAPGRKR